MTFVKIRKALVPPGFCPETTFYDFEFESGVRLTLNRKTATELVFAIRSIIDGTNVEYIIKEPNCTIQIGSDIDYESGTRWFLIMVPGKESSFQNHLSLTFSDREATSIVDPEVWATLASSF